MKEGGKISRVDFRQIPVQLTAVTGLSLDYRQSYPLRLLLGRVLQLLHDNFSCLVAFDFSELLVCLGATVVVPVASWVLFLLRDY